MSQKTDHIVEAAKRMFMRYGYSKTTMGDIAQEAGVARQTLYNAFPGKDEILRIVVRRAGEDTLQDVKKAWQSSESVEQKLDDFLNLGPVTWYEAVQAAPDAAELIEGMHGAAAAELDQLATTWQTELTAMIETTHPHRRNDVPSLGDVVEFFYAAAFNAKYGVEDVDHLKTRLAVLKAATLALL